MSKVTRSLSYSSLGRLAWGMVLVAGCVSSSKSQSPAAAPTNPSPATARVPAVACGDELEPRSGVVGIPERESATAQRGTMKSFKPLDWSKKTTTNEGTGETASFALVAGALSAVGAPPVFAARRASEALDRLAGVAAIRYEKRGAVITLPTDRLVDSGEWELSASGRYNVKELAAGLRDQAGRAIRIQGYTDSMGTPDANDALSLRRAEAVRDFLIAQGVAPESMHAEGLGAGRPVADNRTAEGRAQNRRIEIVVAP